MFYSRPKIEPLGWDLVDLPTPNGSKNFDALTSDGRPLDFRFSSGWLTVEQGEAGAELVRALIGEQTALCVHGGLSEAVAGVSQKKGEVLVLDDEGKLVERFRS